MSDRRRPMTTPTRRVSTASSHGERALQRRRRWSTSTSMWICSQVRLAFPVACRARPSSVIVQRHHHPLYHPPPRPPSNEKQTTTRTSALTMTL